MCEFLIIQIWSYCSALLKKSSADCRLAPEHEKVMIELLTVGHPEFLRKLELTSTETSAAPEQIIVSSPIHMPAELQQRKTPLKRHCNQGGKACQKTKPVSSWLCAFLTTTSFMCKVKQALNACNWLLLGQFRTSFRWNIVLQKIREACFLTL